MSVRFERAGSWAWSSVALPEIVVDPSGGPGGALPMRLAPSVILGGDGARWLVSRSGVVARIDGDDLRAISLAAADCDQPIVAPMGDGVIVVGRRGNDNVLAALDARGARRWRRAGAHGDLAGTLEVHADPAGGIFLSARDRGAIARVDVATGATTALLELERRDVPLQIAWGRAAWIEANGAARRWVTRPLDGGDARAIELPAEVRGVIAPRPAPLPDGGLLARDGRTLLWMRPDASLAGFVAFGGAIPIGADGLAIGLRHRGHLDVTTWRGGVASASVALAPVGAGDELVAAGDELLVAEGAALGTRTARFDARGARLGEGPASASSRAVVDLGFPAVLADGSAIVVGTHPAGAYAIRIEVPYR